MPDPAKIAVKLFNVKSDNEFNELALELFCFQYKNNTIYRKFADLLKRTPDRINGLKEIPYMPVEFFKSHKITSYEENVADLYFESSGTTGSDSSRHHVKDASIYRRSFQKGFEYFFGPVDSYCFFGLLPSYLERKNSSLIYMVNSFIQQTKDNGSGFFLYDFKSLLQQIQLARRSGRKIILWGVAFALLDLIEEYPLNLPDIIVIETGGMKGRKKEITREEMHYKLKNGFGTDRIYSEYGMTEMLSQAYSTGNGMFNTVPWLKILIREINDPCNLEKPGKTGGINVIDLANIYSCSFIATQDLGRVYADGTFEVLGRFDNSDIRGCSLLV